MSRASRQTEGGFTLVELLVTVLLMGVIATAITGAVISSLRVEQDQQRIQDVIDDGRISIERIRQELRQVRRVYESSGPDRLHVWVDFNQNAVVDPEEQLCYVVEPVPGGTAGQWQIARWASAVDIGTEAEDYDDGDCVPGLDPLPPGETRHVVARTLTDDEPFVDYSPEPAGPLEPQTREVTIHLQLEVLGGRGTDQVDVHSTIRLRNVP
jgi:prepilin-type N-terminal cleavage/methylation domain-containing protein